MSYVIAAPEMLATAAADVDGIGSAIRAASASAAGPTTGLLAAARPPMRCRRPLQRCSANTRANVKRS
ncbi:PE family protein [Mycobacterium tuberculosis]|nr:PE family protein [Mycobacterium tuberculosis]